MNKTQLEETISMFEYLVQQIDDPKRKTELTVLYLNFSSEFSTANKLFMEQAEWTKNFASLQSYFGLLKTLRQGAADPFKVCINFLRGEDVFYTIHNLIELFVYFLSELERNRDLAIRYLDRKEAEYGVRLKDEIAWMALAKEGYEYLVEGEFLGNAAKIAQKLMMHVHHLSDTTIARLSEVIPNYPFTKESARVFIEESRVLIQRHLSSKRNVQINELSVAYNFAVNNKGAEARDLLMRFPIPDQDDASSKTGLAFNRALVQLAFCTFQ